MQVGDTVTFQLLKRPRSSIIPLEVSGAPADSAGVLGLAPPTAGDATKQQAGDASRGQNLKSVALGDVSTSAWERQAEGEGASGQQQAAVPECNRFAKFTTASDAAPLWLEAARELAQYAAEVRASAPAGAFQQAVV